MKSPLPRPPAPADAAAARARSPARRSRRPSIASCSSSPSASSPTRSREHDAARRRGHRHGSDDRRDPGAGQRPDLRPERLHASPPTSRSSIARRSTSTSRARPSSRSSPRPRSKCCACRRRGCSTPAPATSASARAASTTCTATRRCRSWTSSSSRATSARSRSARRSGSDVVSRYVYRFGFGEALARDIPHQRAGLVDKRPAAVQAERAGLGVDGLPDRRHAAADGGGGRLDRQRRRAGRAARRRARRSSTASAPRCRARSSAARFRREIADELTTILEQVVERGTAKRGADPRLHHRRQDRHRREARERPLLEGPQQRVVRRLRAVAAPARGDPRDPRLAAPRRPHRRRGGGADLPRRRRGDAAPARRAAERARSARPAGRAAPRRPARRR